MATPQVQDTHQTGTGGKAVVNDFSMTVATKNGSGSQTSNLTLLRALFKMGIPVSGKNLFPSNIQGLPTWYTIRLSKKGYLARRAEQSDQAVPHIKKARKQRQHACERVFQTVWRRQELRYFVNADESGVSHVEFARLRRARASEGLSTAA